MRTSSIMVDKNQPCLMTPFQGIPPELFTTEWLMIMPSFGFQPFAHKDFQLLEPPPAREDGQLLKK